MFPSLRLDSHDDVHLVYVAAGSPEKLMYAYRPSDTKKWFSMAITVGHGATDLALDSKGHPNVVFELSGARLWFTSFDGTTWQSPTHISPESGTIEYSCTVAIDNADRPHLFWYQLTYANAGFFHIRHAELADGQWHASTLDDGRETGKWHSAISGPDGQLYVVYSAFQDAQLKLAHFDGKEWSNEVVDQRPPGKDNGIHPIFGGSLVLDKDGSPLIAYEDENHVKLARKVDGKWKTEDVDPILPFTNRERWWELNTSIAIDRAGGLHIVYTDAGAAKHAYLEDGKWHTETLVGAGADTSRFPKLAAGKDGNLYVVYRDPDDGALMFATGRPSKAPAATNAAAQPQAAPTVVEKKKK
jgi:hypothetical protein